MSNSDRFGWLRLPKEKTLGEEIFNDPMIQHLLRQEQQTRVNEVIELDPMWKHALPFRAEFSPALARAIEVCKKKLEITVPVEVFIVPRDGVNAAFIGVDEKTQAARFYFTAGAIQKLSEEALTAVAAHEFGHYEFHRNDQEIRILECKYFGELKPVLQMKLRAWSRAREISADRMSLYITSSYDTVLNALFRVSFGIDGGSSGAVNGYLDEVSEKIKVSDPHDFPDDFYSTHPFSPSRLLALREFQAIIADPAPEKVARTNEAVDKYLSYFENPFVSNPELISKEVKKCLFYLAGELILVDGKIEDSELEKLRTALEIEDGRRRMENLEQADPENSIQVIESLANRAISHLEGRERFDLLKSLILLSAADGYVSESEIDILRYATNLFGFEQEALEKAFHSAGVGRVETGPDKELPPRAMKLKIAIWKSMIRSDPNHPAGYVNAVFDLKRYLAIQDQRRDSLTDDSRLLAESLKMSVEGFLAAHSEPICVELLCYLHDILGEVDPLVARYQEHLVGKPTQLQRIGAHQVAAYAYLEKNDHRGACNAFLSEFLHGEGILPQQFDTVGPLLGEVLDAESFEGLVATPEQILRLAQSVIPQHPKFRKTVTPSTVPPTQSQSAPMPGMAQAPAMQAGIAFQFSGQTVDEIVAEYQAMMIRVQMEVPPMHQMTVIQQLAQAYEQAIQALMARMSA